MIPLTNSIFIAGSTGLVGSALKRSLKERGFDNLLTPSHEELDLLDSQATRTFFCNYRPDIVFLAAARVGGIKANNQFPVEFLQENLTLQTNVISSSFEFGVKKLVFLGSSCIYPKHAEQPISEEALLTAPLEPTNEGYAIAKIAGIKLCQAYRRQYGCNYISVMPTNLYGPGDNFDEDSGHVLPALISKFHRAKTENWDKIELMGTGQALREFLFVEDLASAILLLLELYNGMDPINIGYGSDISIRDLSEKIAVAVGYKGKIVFTGNGPDGTPRKLLDSSKIQNLGWRPKVDLEKGLRETYKWFLKEEINETHRSTN